MGETTSNVTVFKCVCCAAILSCVSSIHTSDGVATDGVAGEGTERIMTNAAPAFCEGMYMAMFMDGFHWSTVWRKGAKTPACLNYFVATWKLENASAFGGACFFSFLLAILLESFVATRSFALQRMPRATLPTISTILYALQALLGYVLMIVAMTFSIELIGSVIVGLIVGKYIFSSYDDGVDVGGGGNRRTTQDEESIPLAEEQTQTSLSDNRSASLVRRRGDR